MAILVPIDLTAPSRSAVALAATLARALGQDALLLHVARQPPPLDLLAELHGIAGPIRDNGVRVSLRTARGDPADKIAEYAQKRDCTWIVMGTHGPERTGCTGSVAEGVMQRSHVPVAAVRPGPADAALHDHDRPIALVADRDDGQAARLAATLARTEATVVRRFHLDPSGGPPAIVPADGVQATDFAVAVIEYPAGHDADARLARILEGIAQPVILVADGQARDVVIPRQMAQRSGR